MTARATLAGRGPGAVVTVHRCPVGTRVQCSRMIPAGRLMCVPHWRRVPERVRVPLWQAWNDGRPPSWSVFVSAMLAALAAAEQGAGR